MLRRLYGRGRWRKLKGIAMVRLRGGVIRKAELHRQELHKIYRLLADDDAADGGDLRVVDESGEDYLYPAAWFVPVELPRRVRTSLLRRPRRLQSA